MKEAISCYMRVVRFCGGGCVSKAVFLMRAAAAWKGPIVGACGLRDVGMAIERV
jgi:hypothetical protein